MSCSPCHTTKGLYQGQRAQLPYKPLSVSTGWRTPFGGATSLLPEHPTRAHGTTGTECSSRHVQNVRIAGENSAENRRYALACASTESLRSSPTKYARIPFGGHFRRPLGVERRLR